MRVNYYEFPGLDQLFLEDSWVWGMEYRRSVLAIHLLAVLTENHPDYAPPPPDKQYCYAELSLVFMNVTEIRFESFRFLSEFSEGKLNWGGIDWLHEENGVLSLGGNWGELRLVSSRPTFMEKRKVFPLLGLPMT